MIHSTLKQSTRTLHVSLENKLRFLLSDKVSLEQYVAVQKKFYGFYGPIEAQLLSICDWNDPEFVLDSRLKVPLLVADLRSLGVESAELTNLPVCESLPQLETVPEALGCLYVLEGSTLGGKIITRHLKNVLRLNEIRGCSFFASYGDDVGRMWSSFLGILTRRCERQDDADVVVRSACQTFAALDRWFAHVN